MWRAVTELTAAIARLAVREGLLPVPEDEALGLVPIEMSEVCRAASADRAYPDLQLAIGRARINVPVGFNAAHLRRLMTALR